MTKKIFNVRKRIPDCVEDIARLCIMNKDGTGVGDRSDWSQAVRIIVRGSAVDDLAPQCIHHEPGSEYIPASIAWGMGIRPGIQQTTGYGVENADCPAIRARGPRIEGIGNDDFVTQRRDPHSKPIPCNSGEIP